MVSGKVDDGGCCWTMKCCTKISCFVLSPAVVYERILHKMRSIMVLFFFEVYDVVEEGTNR